MKSLKLYQDDFIFDENVKYKTCLVRGYPTYIKCFNSPAYRLKSASEGGRFVFISDDDAMCHEHYNMLISTPQR